MLNIEQLKAQIETIKSQIDEINLDIHNKKKEIDRFEYTMSDDEFNEVLDCEGIQQTSVGSFYPSDILKSCDPIGYRCAKSDYEGNYDLDECYEYQELQDELRNLENDLEVLQDQLENLENDLSTVVHELHNM